MRTGIKIALVSTLAGLVVGCFSGEADADVTVESGPTHRHMMRCVEEDSAGPCVWDAKHMGNGFGDSFIANDDGTVTYVKHLRAHRLAFPYRVEHVEGLGTGHTIAYVRLYDGEYLRVDHCTRTPNEGDRKIKVLKECGL